MCVCLVCVCSLSLHGYKGRQKELRGTINVGTCGYLHYWLIWWEGVYHVCKCVSECVYNGPSGRRYVSGATESALIPSCLTWGLQPPDPLLGVLAYITVDTHRQNSSDEERSGEEGGKGNNEDRSQANFQRKWRLPGFFGVFFSSSAAFSPDYTLQNVKWTTPL